MYQMEKIMTGNKPMAVVVGSGLNALGVVRSLAVANIPVQLLCDGLGAAAHTRYAKKVFIESTGGEPLVAALRRIARQGGDKPVLFLTEEKSVLTVSEQRNQIQPYFFFAFPDHETLLALMHKQRFQELANEFGSPIPKAVHLRGDKDLTGLTELRYPCVLKPAVKDYGYGAKFQKAYVVQSAEEASARYKEIAPTLTDIIVQEWIEGTDSDIYFCLQYIATDGYTVASFVGRKIRSWPPRIGGTASCTAAPECQDELSAITGRFFGQTGFVGMCSMEYKRDARDGRFYMVEPTVGRTDFQEEVATIHGTNIPLAAYCYEVGTASPAVTVPTRGKLWREPITDRWSAQLQPHLLSPPDIQLIDAYWRWDDPMPWVFLTLGRIRDRIARWQPDG